MSKKKPEYDSSVSIEKGSAIKIKENKYLRNLKPEMSKTVKGNHRINEIN